MKYLILGMSLLVFGCTNYKGPEPDNIQGPVVDIEPEIEQLKEVDLNIELEEAVVEDLDNQGVEPVIEQPNQDIVPKATETKIPQEVEPICTVFDDFSEESQRDWFIVNDTVMGGRSIGNGLIDNNQLAFRGTTNTNGGGFASFRVGLPKGILNDYQSVRIEGESDGRGYDLTFRDGQQWRISHRTKMLFKEGVSVTFLKDLEPAFFGRNIRTDAFEKSSAREMGIILNDGLDGPFEIKINSVSFCK